jgi:parvulin-like peptidyl-prolyl isomerase
MAAAQLTIQLSPGRPLLSADDINRMIRQRGFGQAIAQVFVMDEILRSVSLDDQQVDVLVEAYLLERDVTSLDERIAYLRSENIDGADLVERATAAKRLQLFSQQRHGADVESHFLDRKLYLDQVTYSLIRVRDADLAAEIYQQIRDGEADFDQLASTFSEGQERESRGLVGPVPLGAAHPDLMARLRVGEPGQLWEPFFIVDIWLVVRLEQRFTAQLDQKMREQLERDLFDTWFHERVRALVAGEVLSPLQSQLT